MSVGEHQAPGARAKFVPWIDPFLSGLGRRPFQLGRLYCVGDVHDRDDLLRQMAERVEAETEPSSFDNAACIFEQILLRLLDGGAGAFESSPAAMPIARSKICLSG